MDRTGQNAFVVGGTARTGRVTGADPRVTVTVTVTDASRSAGTVVATPTVPGMVRSDAAAKGPEDRHAAIYRDTGATVPVGRARTGAGIAGPTVMAATNRFGRGHVITVDRGHMIRQDARG